MAEELSWKYDARKGCEKTITLGAYSLVISKWHVYHIFEQDWLQRGLIFKKVNWMFSLKFRILGEPKIAVYLRYKKGVIIPGGKKNYFPAFHAFNKLCIIQYAWVYNFDSVHAFIVVCSRTPTNLDLLSQRKAPLSPFPLGLVCFERDRRRKWQSLDHENLIWSKVTVTVSTIDQWF